MESEIELNQVIQEMHTVSTRPDFYPILLDSTFLQCSLGLISHENIGILVKKNFYYILLY